MKRYISALLSICLLAAVPAGAQASTSWTESRAEVTVLPWIEKTSQVLKPKLNYYPASGLFPEQICLKVNGTDKFTSQSGVQLPTEKTWLSQIVDLFSEDIVLTKAQSRSFFLNEGYRVEFPTSEKSCAPLRLQGSRDGLIGGNNDGNANNDFAGGINFSFQLETRNLKPGSYAFQFSFLPNDGTTIPPLSVNIKSESGFKIHDPGIDWRDIARLKSSGQSKTYAVGTGKSLATVSLRVNHKAPVASCERLDFTYSLGDKKALSGYFLNLELYHPNKAIAGYSAVYSNYAVLRTKASYGLLLCPYTWYEDVLQTGSLREYEGATPGTYTGLLTLSHPTKPDWKTRFTIKLSK